MAASKKKTKKAGNRKVKKKSTSKKSAKKVKSIKKPKDEVILDDGGAGTVELGSKFEQWKRKHSGKDNDSEGDISEGTEKKGLKGFLSRFKKKDSDKSEISKEESVVEAKEEAKPSLVKEPEKSKKESKKKKESKSVKDESTDEDVSSEKSGKDEEELEKFKEKVKAKLHAKDEKKETSKERDISVKQEGVELIKTYEFSSKNIPITINILKKKGEYVPIYDLKIAKISRHTEIFLEKIRKELIREVNLGIVDITDLKKSGIVEERFSETIVNLLNKYFPDIDEETMDFLTSYLIQKSLGLGKLELLRDDPHLEEIAINSADEPIWVYQREYGWVKTTVVLENDDQTRHFASIIGRKVGRQLTVLEPLLDANLDTGDRINATLMPISNKGNTITLRRFASKPWTITDLVSSKTMSVETASLVWLGMQYELSLLIAGGTASGKTSTLNALCNFFPPNHRIISIEDTREIQLPSFLHWIPMVTRLPNAEGKGEVGMLHLLVNALRQRPDRILVGEVRRKKEAEVLFEAIHTGHSVYATFHANNAHEAIMRLTSPPIEVPLAMLPAISMILVQYRNRRSGLRRTFQIAEILEDGSPNVILQYDAKKDTQVKENESKSLMKTLSLYTGMSTKEIKDSIAVKTKILKWMVKHEINTVDTVGRIMAEYYTNYDNLMKFVNKNKSFVEQ